MSRKSIHIIIATLLLLASLPVSADFRYWSTISPLPKNLTLYGLHWDGSQFIAVGERGAVLTSSNGMDWATHKSGLTADLNDIILAGGNYIAGGGWDGTLLQSVGATLDNWQYSKTGHRWTLRSIAYNGVNLYVAVGDGDTTTGSVLVTSPDGINWTAQAAGTGYPLLDVIWDDIVGQFVIVGGSRTDNTSLIITGNGVTPWTQTSIDVRQINGYPPGSGVLHAVNTDGSGVYIAVGDAGAVWRYDNNDLSPAWATVTSGTNYDLQSIAYSGSQFLAVGYKCVSDCTTNLPVYGSTIINGLAAGATWSESTTTPSISLNNTLLHAATWGGGRFVVAGTGMLLTTTDPTTPDSWTAGTGTISDPLTGIATNSSGTRLAVSGNGNVYSSSDGFAWSQIATGTGYAFDDVVWDPATTLYVAIAGGNSIVTSPDGDGITWSPVATTGLGSGLKGITAGGSPPPVYVVVGDSGLLQTSTDLINWSTPPPSSFFTSSPITGENLTGISWNGDDNEFLVVSDNPDQFLRSTDSGASWYGVTAHLYSSGGTPLSYSLHQALQDIAWSGSQYVAVGNGNNVLFSDDGYVWTWPQGPDIPAGNLKGISWHSTQGRFIAVGDNGAIIASAGTDLSVSSDPGVTTSSELNLTAIEAVPLDFTFTAQNNSDFTARNVTLTIDLPQDSDASFSTTDGRCISIGLAPLQSLSCVLGNLTTNATTQVVVTVTPLTPIKNTDMHITATASASGPEALPSDNSLVTSNYVWSTEDQIAYDYNNKSGGGAGLGPVGLGLLLMAWLMATGRRRQTIAVRR